MSSNVAICENYSFRCVVPTWQNAKRVELDLFPTKTLYSL
jgi:hypothetical protein